MSNPKYIAQQVLNLFEKKITGYNKNTPKEFSPDLKHNSDNFRCEEFKKNHKDTHILFSGCSVTYGLGLLEDEIWAKKLYNKIKQEIPVSGFFNLGITGTGICDIVANIFKYIDNFGKPDLIFICIPSMHRRYFWNEITDRNNEKNIYHYVYQPNEKDEFLPIIEVHSFHYLMFLEMFCKSNNIKLYYFSYNKYFPKMELERFFKIDQELLKEKVTEYCTNNPNNKNAITARDKKHFGEAYHEFWADFCYNLYKEDK